MCSYHHYESAFVKSKQQAWIISDKSIHSINWYNDLTGSHEWLQGPLDVEIIPSRKTEHQSLAVQGIVRRASRKNL